MPDLPWRSFRGARARAASTMAGGSAAALVSGAGWRRAARSSERCGASGWQLRVACTDGIGSAVCPLCGRRVAARPDAGAARAFSVIQEHRVLGTRKARRSR